MIVKNNVPRYVKKQLQKKETAEMKQKYESDMTPKEKWQAEFVIRSGFLYWWSLLL